MFVRGWFLLFLVSLYPSLRANPNASGGARQSLIRIYNLLGEEVHRQGIATSNLSRYLGIESPRNDEVEINLSHLPSGTYILELEGYGRTRIMKQ